MAADPLTVASAIFAGVSALSDAITLWRTSRGRGETPPVEEIVKILEADVVAKIPTETTADFWDSIDPEDLEVIRRNIDRAKDSMRRSLIDPNNGNEARDRAIDMADSAICSELRRIKRLNEDRLPGREYERWWRSHRCQE